MINMLNIDYRMREEKTDTKYSGSSFIEIFIARDDSLSRKMNIYLPQY